GARQTRRSNMATIESSATVAGTTTWNIDPAHTLVEFSAKHMMITSVKGRFGEVAGTIVIDDARPERSSVTAEIQVASIDTRVEQRDAHLRSADFLDVENHPTLTFRSTRVEGAATSPGDTFRVVGELTIRGTTREVTLDATYEGSGRDPWGGERVSFSATAKIDRRDFGLTYNQVLEAGGILVGNDIRLSFEVQAVRAA
ncbi:MAG TPA: YceI family protein, partial [Longimicrobiaceae bacterium]|nr:YceI family protein [Longimicrobiaceae bacterium]